MPLTLMDYCKYGHCEGVHFKGGKTNIWLHQRPGIGAPLLRHYFYQPGAKPSTGCRGPSDRHSRDESR
ncbi:hypothetical protein MHYP_G00291740 [Metynnis hypsauchen]